MPEEPKVYRQSRFVPPKGSTQLILVRHGESQPYQEDIAFPQVEGHGDPPLAPIGHRQAEAVAEALGHLPIDQVAVTILQRTHQTAAPLAGRLGLDPIVVPELREVHLGDWEGGSLRKKASEGDPIFAEVLRNERWDVIPGAEAHDDFRARVRDGIRLLHDAHPDQLVVAVVHGGVIGMAMAEATGSRGFAFMAADNASITRLVIHDDRWHVRSYNETWHLAGIEDIDG